MITSKTKHPQEEVRMNWPNRIALQMVRQVPCRMHQPRDSNERVGSQSGINDRRREERIRQLPRAKTSIQVGPQLPATRIALKVRRAGSATRDMKSTKQGAAMAGP
jgi:hypothetical protein